MTKNFSFRGATPKAFLMLAIMSLFAVSCSSGENSAGPRTRNAGSEATIAVCQESWGTVITVDEENQLLADLAAAVASLEVAKSAWLEDTESAKQKLDSLDMVAFNSDLRMGKNVSDTETIETQIETILELPGSWESIVSAFKKVIDIEQKLLLANVINPSGAGDVVAPIIASDEMTSYEPADTSDSALSNYEDALNNVDYLRQLAETLEAEDAVAQAVAADRESRDAATRQAMRDFLNERGIEYEDDKEPGAGLHGLVWHVQETLIGKAFGGEKTDHMNLYNEAGGPDAGTVNAGNAMWGQDGLQFILNAAGDKFTEEERQSLIAANTIYENNNNDDHDDDDDAVWVENDERKKELDQLHFQIAAAEERAAAVQDDGREGFGTDTGFVVQMGLDPCVQLKEDILAEGVVKLLSALESVLAQAPTAMMSAVSDNSVDEAAVIALADTAEDSDDGSGSVGVVVGAYQVSVESDEQVQIPTMVMLSDNATVEIEEIVSEIVVTPAAAQQMMVNAGVSQGSVVVKTDGEWQIVDLESIVIPVTSDTNAVEIRVVPNEPSQQVVAQSVALKRKPVQQLQTIEEFAAAITPLSSDDSSSLIWVLYVVIVVLAVGVAAIFVQRRKSMATN